MTPSALLVISLAGLVSCALGAAILLTIGRARFRRRNSYGQLVFRSYGCWLLFRGAIALLRPLGVLLLFNGTVLLLAALNAPPEAWHAGTPAAPAGWKAAAHD
jgi:succinate-acetate transporter protein